MNVGLVESPMIMPISPLARTCRVGLSIASMVVGGGLGGLIS
jgi:hypothetical protein